MNRDIMIAVMISFLTQIIIWFQLNGQLVWKPFKDHPLLLSLIGIPISYAWILCTEYVANQIARICYGYNFICIHYMVYFR